MTNLEPDDNFDPEEMESIARRLDEIFIGEEEGYEMIFYVSYNDAEEILETYEKAQAGDTKAIRRCYLEMCKILEALKAASKNEETE